MLQEISFAVKAFPHSPRLGESLSSSASLLLCLVFIAPGLPSDSEVKNLPAMQKTWVRSLAGEDPLGGGHGNPLEWRTPWTEEPGRLQSIGSHRVRHNWSDLARKELFMSKQDNSHYEALEVKTSIWFLERYNSAFNIAQKVNSAKGKETLQNIGDTGKY